LPDQPAVDKENAVQENAVQKFWEIGGSQGDHHSQRRLVRRSCQDGLFQMFGRQSDAGEGQPGRAGFRFPVSLAVVVVEKAAGQPKCLS